VPRESQHIPFARTGLPPSSVISPPETAVVVVISVTATVVITGISVLLQANRSNNGRITAGILNTFFIMNITNSQRYNEFRYNFTTKTNRFKTHIWILTPGSGKDTMIPPAPGIPGTP
jgi:hypothetical protein